MKSRVKVFITATCVMLLLAALPVSSAAQEHHRQTRGTHRTIIVYPYDYGWGWGWNPYWDPYWGTPYGYYQSNTGTVKLKDVDKHDLVYLNGSLAGQAGHLKSMNLPPGTYSVEVKHDGRDVINQRVYVATGKTVKLDVGDVPRG